VGCITYNINELNPDLLDVLSDWEGGRNVRNSHNATELAKLYVLWYLKKLNSLPVFSSSGKTIVSMPKLRYFRRDYYAWLKHLEIPKLNWVLITLTLSRDISIQDAWAYIGTWLSDFLRRFRVYLKKKYGMEQFLYFAVPEPHQDEYPHIHLIVSFPFVKVEQIYKWWKDARTGKSLSAFQGVDVQFIGRDTEKIKAYLLKYLVKSHHTYWSFSLSSDGEVRVRLFFMSRLLKRVALQSSQASLYGFLPISALYRAYYKPLGIAFSEFYRCFYDCGSLEKGGLLFSLSRAFRNMYS
jgi:hypothetical protein